MIPPQTLASAQRLALSLMQDRVTVKRVTGEGEPDDAYQPTMEYETVVSDYPCRFRSFEPFETTVEIGGKTTTRQRPALRFPVSTAYIPEVGDIVTLDSSQNPALAAEGRKWRIATRPDNSLSSAFRVYADEVP